MGMWFFMMACNLILPVLMIILRRVFIKNPPKKINNVYGYRTSRSKKNQDTWDIAHLYCGKLWWKIGWSMLPLSIISMLPAIGKNDDFIGVLGAVVISVECIIMFISIFFTERALAKKFD